MSSVGSSYAQKPNRASFLVATQDISNGTTGTPISGLSAIQVLSHSIPASVISLSDISYADAALTVGDLFRDLGREIVVYNDSTTVNSPHVYRFRECQKMNGATTEGADSTASDSTIFIKVSEATGVTVGCARVG
jgi:hypothetical protein